VKRIALALVVGFGVAVAQADEFDVVDYGIFRSIDPLAQRDEWGTTHQTPHVNATDFAPRYAWRWEYYFKARQQLLLDPGYVGSLQTALRRLGYYCGPVDGVYTPEVSYAIARLQKNYSMRVTGTLTHPVRRALHMP
jgi:Putative peptidoglycan binding domain